MDWIEWCYLGIPNLLHETTTGSLKCFTMYLELKMLFWSSLSLIGASVVREREIHQTSA